MPEQTVIVWDLETVRDLAAAARMLDMSNATEADVRQALGEGFPKRPLHKIVCIGALVASRQPEGWRIDALGAPHVAERSEAELISSFAERIGQLRPQMITWNGHAFDLPVLRYRAMVNRVAAEGLQVRQYFHRYTDGPKRERRLKFRLPSEHNARTRTAFRIDVGSMLYRVDLRSEIWQNRVSAESSEVPQAEEFRAINSCA